MYDDEIKFTPQLLSPEYVKQHGVRYDESIMYCEDYETTPLYDKDPASGGKLFTGLLYDFYYDSDMISWYEYYTDGYGDGEYVCFYDNGAVSSYCIMEGYGFVGKLYKWHKNGRLKSYDEKDDNDRYIKTVRLDEDGNITYLLENGHCIINKG
ncbi:MAG: hypothetical protein E7494_01175 [Ruminococcus albus]|jgi:antitoxin component YwqK of YwqJK toxin-antitoxin module|nr:hypothetical protein [Ruminococcus albus]